MATKPEDEEPLELTEQLEPEEPEEQRSDDDPENPEVNDEGETVVAFEGEEPQEPEPDNSTVRQMRQALREKDKRIKELEQSTAPKPIEIGPKPDLWEDCEGDPDKFEKALDEWKDRKAAADRQTETQAEQTRKANEEWQADLASFETKKAALEFDDRDDAIDHVRSTLDLVQQAVIIKSAADPSLFLYALSKSEAKRAEIAKIQDPIKLAAAVARMEGAVKVTKGRRAPEPDRPLRGSGAMPDNSDQQLEKLQKEADRTNDYTKLIAYKKSKGLI